MTGERRVYKYPLPIEDLVTIEMPEGARVLHVGEQQDRAFLWALVDPYAPKEVRSFRVAGTGHAIHGFCRHPHVGTFLMKGGHLVFHVFDMT